MVSKLMKHSINRENIPVPPKVRKDIEDCQGVLADILSWLFDKEVRIVSTEASTEAKDIHLDDKWEHLPLEVKERFMEDAVSGESTFKIVVTLERRKVLTEVMAKLSPEQQAELSGYLLRREHAGLD